ncbi:hypothetical protein J1N35_041152 [Gossypium stocksii]|uniref:Uncharacterized protein n=1 Tax=Gossypium stocksii TaxID=47602 RepID=A0A9D3UEX3_9ROSI|nr:hypothetical protein J1N35_041152 [Gossypium stocksii]
MRCCNEPASLFYLQKQQRLSFSLNLSDCAVMLHYCRNLFFNIVHASQKPCFCKDGRKARLDSLSNAYDFKPAGKILELKMAIELMGTREEEAPLVIDISERETPKSWTRDIHILSCALLVFLAYGAAQNLETTLDAQGNLGMVTLGTLNVSSAVFSLFASLVV